MKGTKCVLVVDDEKFVQNVMKNMIEKCGLSAFCVSDGSEAINEIKANASKYKFVLMDFTMPNIDGITATQQIRKFNKTIKIIGLSGDNDEETTQKAMQAGMNKVLVKPLKKPQLDEIIKTFN